METEWSRYLGYVNEIILKSKGLRKMYLSVGVSIKAVKYFVDSHIFSEQNASMVRCKLLILLWEEKRRKDQKSKLNGNRMTCGLEQGTQKLSNERVSCQKDDNFIIVQQIFG